jgi:hypothetical protein
MRRAISAKISARTRHLRLKSLLLSLIIKLVAATLLRPLPLLLRTTLLLQITLTRSAVVAVATEAAGAVVVVAAKKAIVVAAPIELTLKLQLYLLEHN